MMSNRNTIFREGYSGQIRDQLREGYGTYVFENKFYKYEGQWCRGKSHVSHKILITDSTVVFTYRLNEDIKGHGRLTMLDKSFYEGEFANGEIEGKGFRYFASSGNSYTGDFHQGECEGQGIMQYSDGSSYEGNWCRNKRHGYGLHRMCNGAVYQGNFHNHKRHSEGILIYSNGSSYSGNWVKDVKQGHGVMTYVDGSSYRGQWQQDIRHGQGCFTDVTGVKYEGLWISEQPKNVTTRLRISGPAEATVGEFISLTVWCYDADGSVTSADEGRTLQLLCGMKSVENKVTSKQSKKNLLRDGKGSQHSLRKSSSASTDITASANESKDSVSQVEDENVRSADSRENTTDVGLNILDEVSKSESLIYTPFGYEVTRCRLLEMEALPGRDIKSPSLSSHDVNPAAEDEELKQPSSDQVVENAVEDSMGKDSKDDITVSPEGDQTKSSEDNLVSDSMVSADAVFRKTQGGGAVFEYIAISVPEELHAMDSKSKSCEEIAPSPENMGSSPADQPIITEEESDDLEKKNQILFGGLGEYVLIVQDITDPPFLGLTVEPAYHVIRVVESKSAPVEAEGHDEEKENLCDEEIKGDKCHEEQKQESAT